MAGAFDQLAGGSVLDATDSAHPAVFLAGQVSQFGLTEGIGGLMSGSGSGGGSGAGDILGSIDEAAVIIVVAVVVAILLIVAIPTGILAFEVALGLLALIAGICLRVAHVRPWTILIREDGQTTAAFRVTGWRASQRMLHGLRDHSESLRLDRGPESGGGSAQQDSPDQVTSSLPSAVRFEIVGDPDYDRLTDVHTWQRGRHRLIVRMLSRSGKRLIEFPADSSQAAQDMISSLQAELAESDGLASFLGRHGVPTHLVRDACKDA